MIQLACVRDSNVVSVKNQTSGDTSMKNTLKLLVLATCLFICGCAALGGRPGAGSKATIDDESRTAMTRIGQKLKGLIVWSSSRAGNHNLFTMNPDGSDQKMITHGETVDWFPRFSPDGKRILFCRSKKGWVYERDANMNFKWDLFTVPAEGGEPVKVAEDACWGTWTGPQEILLSRNTKVFRKNIESGKEELLVDSKAVPALGGAELQQPQLSPDGKCLAVTLRGAMRQTGVFDLQNKTWVHTGEGCQVNWNPKGGRIFWVNPSGNGGSEVFSITLEGCKPAREYTYDEMRYMDIPGRRSHEYFPKMSADGKWLVWAATRRGHDHDIADYEIYIWEIGRPASEATRLTFHSGNDRWPDIFIFGS